MKKFFTFLAAALMSASMFATTVTWNSSTLSSITMEEGHSFTKDGVTLTSLDAWIEGSYGDWMGSSNDASFKFSTSLGNFTKIEITATVKTLGGSGWTQTSPGAVWTGDANETTFGKFFENVSQIVFTIEEPEPTGTVVTITQNDFPSWGESFTKDGVTVSAGQIDGGNGNILGGGSFSTTLGNFTQIEVSAIDVSISGEGWSGTRQKKTWTGNASSVSFSSYIMGDGLEVTLKFTIEAASTPTAVENVQASKAQVAKTKKIFRNGQMFILKDGEIFTLTGSKVK